MKLAGRSLHVRRLWFFALCAALLAAAVWGTAALGCQITEQMSDGTVVTHTVSAQPIADQLYQEDGVEPPVTLTLEDGRTLVRDRDYELDYRGNASVGTAYACVDFLWPYEGWFEIPFTIYQIDASAAVITPIPDQYYSGDEITPPVTVTLNGQILRADTDYEVYYYNNESPGTATVRVEFQQSYSGTAQTTFQIVKRDASSAVITPIPDQIYTGYAIVPAVTVFWNGTQLDDWDDYSVSYSNNISVGTATVTVTFEGLYSGTAQTTFRIIQLDGSKATVDPIPAQTYCGWSVEPEVTVRYEGQVLDSWDDYSLEFSNNRYPGTATVKIRFQGRYCGEKSVTFSIVLAPVTGLTARANGTQVVLEWNWHNCADSYLVQRYDAGKKQFVTLKTVSETYYADEGRKELQSCRYRVLPVLRAEGKSWNGQAAEAKVTTGLRTLQLTLKTMNKKIKLSWKPSSKADGYVIYRSTWTDSWTSGKAKKIATLTDAKAKSYVDKKVKNGVGYSYTVRAFKKLNGTTYYSDEDWLYSLSKKAVLAGVKKQPMRTYPVYDTQGKKKKLMFNVTLSDRDCKLLDKFSNKHFKEGWSDEQKMEYTMLWINQKVTYALGSDWTKIESKSYVEAIFKYKLGQCVQYNGAMAAMMIYLGYPAQLIMGYRGTWPNDIWQHFWVESPINGTTYVVECGNAKRSGAWYYFFEPYSETFGYIKNRKNVS